MPEEIVYQTAFPPPTADFQGHHSTADFDAMKRSFEAAALSNPGDKKQRNERYPNPAAGGQQYPVQSAMPGFAEIGQAAVNGTYQGPFGMGGAASFVPQGQLQPQGVGPTSQTGSPNTFSNSGGSPYLGVSPNPGQIPFGSPSSQSNGGQPGQAQSFNGSSYGHFDTNPSSPNAYQQNPYANFGGVPGFGNPSFMMPGMLGMGMGMNGQMGVGGLQAGLGFGGPFPMMSPGLGGLGIGAMGMGSPATQSGRTVYVGNLPSDASVDELLSQVRFGPIESVKILPEKSCAFISFLDPNTAAAFHSDALMRKIRLHEMDLKIGWGKASPVNPTVLAAVQQSGATRNVYIGNLDDAITEQSLRDELSRFGPIDQVKIVRDKNIGFIHFLSIATAIKVIQTLSTDPEWVGRRVNYGKDRCAYVPKNQHQQQQHNLAAAAMGSIAASFGGFPGFNGSFANGAAELGPGAVLDANTQPGNRTVYLGNIHPETTTEEICNTIRGGILQQIRYIPDKHICFVTFVDAQCALAFYQTASFQGIALHNRRLKVGWGKHSGPPTPGIAMVVQSGGSRNVYVGSIEDFDTFNEERLRQDFGEYGEIELINTLREKQCAFVNFTNIANAIKAIESIKSHPDYASMKVAYGKDRCGNPPRSLGFQGHTSFRNNHMNSNNHGGSTTALGSPSLEPFDPTGLGFSKSEVAALDSESAAIPILAPPLPVAVVPDVAQLVGVQPAAVVVADI